MKLLNAPMIILEMTAQKRNEAEYELAQSIRVANKILYLITKDFWRKK